MKNRFLLLTLSLCLSITSYAQEDDLLEFNTFEVGIQLGTSILKGDVFPENTLNIGIHGTKAFSEYFALRATLSMDQLKGFNFYHSSISRIESRTIEELNYPSFVKNYYTQLYDFSLEALFTVHYSNIGMYIGVGPSYHHYNVFYDALDADGSLYDYSALSEVIAQRGDVSKDDIEIVNNILDGEFETPMLTDQNFERTRSIGASARLGINYSINSSFKVGIDTRFLLSFQDNIDGFRGQSSAIFQNDKVFSLSIIGSYIM